MIENNEDITEYLISEYEYENNNDGEESVYRVNASGYGTAISKSNYEYFSENFDKLTAKASYVGGEVIEEFVAPALTGIANLIENITTAPVAAGEIIEGVLTTGANVARSEINPEAKIVSPMLENAAYNYAKAYEESIYPSIIKGAAKFSEDGKSDTWMGPIVKELTQFSIPALGSYKWLGRFFDNKAAKTFYQKAKNAFNRNLGTEVITVGLAQDTETGNFATFISETFNWDITVSENVADAMFDWIATPEKETNAYSFFKSRLKAVVPDAGIGMGFEGVIRVVSALADIGAVQTITRNIIDPELKSETITQSKTEERINNQSGESRQQDSIETIQDNNIDEFQQENISEEPINISEEPILFGMSEKENEALRNYMDFVSQIESNGVIDAKQNGGGPGRGKYQFELSQGNENGSNRVALNRYKNMVERLKVQNPDKDLLDAANNKVNLDFSTLSEKQQDDLFIANFMEHEKTKLADLAEGKVDLFDLWVETHWQATPTPEEYDAKYKELQARGILQ